MRYSIPPHFQTTLVSKTGFLLAALLLCAVLSVVQLGTLHAQTPQPGAGSFSEKEAQGIDRMIMCPVCPAETIDQAQVEIARQMRQMVRAMLAEGKERQEILEFFVDRYGQDILGAPPKSGINLVAWLAPIGGVAAALLAVYFVLRSMARREPLLALSGPIQDVGLLPYLQLVDRYLDMTRSEPRLGAPSNHPGTTDELSGPKLADSEEKT